MEVDFSTYIQKVKELLCCNMSEEDKYITFN